MNKMRLVTNNYTNISELESTPITNTVQNLKTYNNAKVAEADTAQNGGTANITMTMGSIAPVTVVVLGRHNFPIGTTIRIKLLDNLGATVHDSTNITIDGTTAGSDILGWGTFTWGSVVWGADNLSEEFAPSANFVYWVPEIDQINTQEILSVDIQISYPDFILKIGRLIVGEYIQPTYTISYGHGLSWQENTKQYRNDGNTLRSNIALPSRKLEFSLNTINEEDRAVLQKGLRNIGLRKDLFVSLFPEDIDLNKTKDYSGIMKLTRIPSMSEYANLYYKSKYVMEEV